MLIYKRCGCGCEVRPLQIGGAHTCACALNSGRARCMRATQKTVATHTLLITLKLGKLNLTCLKVKIDNKPTEFRYVVRVPLKYGF